MKKKMYFVLMALLLSFTFNACSSDESAEVLPEKEEPEVPSEKYENDVVNPDYVPIDWGKQNYMKWIKRMEDIHLVLRLKLKI